MRSTHFLSAPHMRKARIRTVVAISLATLLVACSSGMKEGKKPGPGKDAMQRSSRVLKKKKHAGAATASKAPVEAN